MTISNAILKPYLSKLRTDFELLFQQVGFQSDYELNELKSKIQQELETIARIQADVMILENHQKTLAPFEIYTAYKSVKRSLHTLKRTFERFNSNQERIRKMQERRSHVAIFAA